jgi:hypothetical protein
MRRHLSSQATLFYKVIFPAVWIVGFIVGTVLLFTLPFRDRDGRPPPPFVPWAFLALTVAGSAFLCKTFLPLKWVWLEDGRLHVSDGRRAEAVPLHWVQSVRELKWMRPEMIEVELRRAAGFGRKAVFVPRLRWVAWGPHPVTGEMLDAVADWGEWADDNPDAPPDPGGR